VLIEREFHATLLKLTDAAFERGCQAMASLYSEAAHEFDGRKGVFLLDWEVLIRWVNILEQRKANLHAQHKEELPPGGPLLSLRSSFSSSPPSPTYMLEDPLEGEAGKEQAGDGDADDEEDS